MPRLFALLVWGGLVAGALASAASIAPAQTMPRVQLVQEVRLDGATQDFSDVRTILVGRDGRIVIPLEQDHHVRFYDASGRRIASVGQAGDGPGEFDRVSDYVGWLGDTLWVHDFNPRRLTLISPSHAVTRTMSTVPPGSSAPPASMPNQTPRVSMTNTAIRAVYPDGSMLVRWGFGPRDPVSFSATDWRLVRVLPTGEIVRDVLRMPQTEGYVYHRDASGGVHSTPVPFFARPLESIATSGQRVAVLTTRIASDAGGTYALTVVRSTGDTAFTRTYPFTGVRVARPLIDSALAAITRRQMDVAIELRAKASALVPSVFAPVTSLLLGEDETVWLGVYSPDVAPHYLMLDGRGVPSGEVVLPRRATLVRANRTHVWTIERDADDLPSVVRYRIQQTR